MARIQFRCIHCNAALEQPFEMLGQLIDCPSCGEVVEVQKSHKLPRPPQPATPRRDLRKLKMPKPPQSARRQSSKQREYKVLAQSDERFADGFSPAKLEDALNAFAATGWHVVSVLQPGASDGVRELWMIILSRFKSPSPAKGDR